MLGRSGYVAKVLGNVLREEAIAHAMRRSTAADSAPDASRRARARAVRRALEQLGPFYIKVGQMLSTRPDIVPDYIREELQNLHEEVSVAPFETFEPILEADLGPEWREMFREIHTEKPLGAASLAQVYRVVLHDGRDAVVKIQRPGVAAIMRADMALLRKLSRSFAKRVPDFNELLDIESMLGAIFTGMEPELDFTVEAQNMNNARDLIARFEHLAVPEVIHVTERVLVQQLAPGCSIRDANRSDFDEEERKAIGHELLAMMLRGVVIDRMFHADPHPGNVFVAPGQPAMIIDWGMCGRLDRRMSLGLVGIFLNLSRNDGEGLAKAWIEIGRATSRANIPAFVNDMSAFVPTISGASLDDLNFGVAFTSVLKHSTRRGIQTSPAISLIGKALANIEGSVRYLAPELEVMGVFREEFQDLAFDLVRETISEEGAAKLVLDGIQAASSAPEQARSILRDAANRESGMRVTERRGPLLANDPLLKALVVVALARMVWPRSPGAAGGP